MVYYLCWLNLSRRAIGREEPNLVVSFGREPNLSKTDAIDALSFGIAPNLSNMNPDWVVFSSTVRAGREGPT